MGAVHAGLAADTAVHLGKKRCRYLNEGDTAQQDARGEAGEVAHDPAAQRHQRGRPLDPAVQDVVQHATERRQVLAALPRLDDQVGGREAGRPQGVERRVEIEPSHDAVGDHNRRAACQERRHVPSRLADEAGAHHDVVAARSEFDTHRLPVMVGSWVGVRRAHRVRPRCSPMTDRDPGSRRCASTCAPSAPSTASTVCSCGPSPLSTTTSASA